MKGHHPTTQSLNPAGDRQPWRLHLSDLVSTWGKAADTMLGSRGCMLTFHRAADPGRWEQLPNRNFYLDIAFLDRLLGYLTATGWHVVTVEEAIRRAAQGRPGDRYVNFSIDDCYRDTFDNVVPLFRRHGVPVTLYVTTGIPDASMTLWDAGLEDTVLHRDRVRLDGMTIDIGTPEKKRAVYARIARAWDGPQAAARYIRFCSDNGIDAAELHWRHAISWDMLAALRDDPCVEIGAHTVSHPRISTLTPQAALHELQEGRKRLQAMLGLQVRHFAFPYGRSGDCGPRDFDIARRAGFASAATTSKGLIRQGQDVFSLPRNTLNGMHRQLAMVEMHLCGLTGIAAKVLGHV